MDGTINNEYQLNNSDRESTQRDKILFLQYLEKSRGIVSLGCNKIGISRATYYNWLKMDKEFKKAVNAILNMRIEMMEETLVMKANNGDIKASMYMISRLERNRNSKKQNKPKVVHIYHHTESTSKTETIPIEKIWNEYDWEDDHLKTEESDKSV